MSTMLPFAKLFYFWKLCVSIIYKNASNVYSFLFKWQICRWKQLASSLLYIVFMQQEEYQSWKQIEEKQKQKQEPTNQTKKLHV